MTEKTPPKSSRFAPPMALLAAACLGTTAAQSQTNITANSLAQLRALGTSVNNASVTLSATGGDPHPVTGVVTPGQYWINGDHIADPTNSRPIFLDLGGTGNTYNLGGATINLDTRKLDGFGRNLGHDSGVDVVQINGSNNTVRGLNLIGQDIALDSDPNAQRYADWGAQYVELSGDSNTVDGAHVVTRGSRTDTYGLGDAFGKGASNGIEPFIAHRKASAFRVGEATNAVANDIHLEVNTFGHGFFVQTSTDTTLTNSTITGQLFSSNDVIARPEYQEAGHTFWGNEIPADIQISGAEAGVRVYTGASGLTVDSVVVTNTRTAFGVALASGDVILNNVEAYGNEIGFGIRDNTTITNAKGDIVNGPLISSDRATSTTLVEVELVGDIPVGVAWAVANVTGSGANITISSDLPASALPEGSLIRLGQADFQNWRNRDTPTSFEDGADPLTDATFNNNTNQLVILGPDVTGLTGSSQAPVITNGKNNAYDGISIVLDGTRTVLTSSGGLGNNGTADDGTLESNASVVIDGATLEIQAGIRIEDEKLTITGDGIDGKGALYSDGSNDSNTRFGSSNSSDESTIVLDGDSSIGVRIAGNQLLAGRIQGTGNLTKRGEGTLVLGKSSTYDGDLTIEQGHIIARAGAVHTNLTVAAAASIESIGGNAFNTTGDVQLHGTLDLNNRTNEVVLAATLGLLSGSGRITVGNNVGDSGGVLTLAGSDADGAYTGTLDGNISLIKAGTNTQSLSGAATHTGTTTVNDGTLLINAAHTGGDTYTVNGGTLGGSGTITAQVNVNDGATLAPGALGIGTLGTLNLGSDLNLAQGSTFAAELFTASISDRVAVSGATTLAGDLALQASSSLADYTPYTLLTSEDGITGTFATIDGVVQDGNTGLAVTYTANAVNLTRARLGDINLDGDVDVFQFNGGGDAQVLSSNLGTLTQATFTDGDFNGDGDVDVFQFNGQGDAQTLSSNLGFNQNSSNSLVTTSLSAVLAIDTVAATTLDTDVDTPSQTAAGTYNPTTGEIVFTIGSGIGVLGLESLAGGQLVPANLSDALAAAQATATTIAFFNPNGLDTGSFSLRAIVTPGTSVDDLGFAFTPLGADTVTAALTVVPEPTTLALLGLSALSLVRRRRYA